jgi:NADH-quinone oxidoreductase subunit L
MPNHIDVTITNVVPHEFHSKALYISMPIVIISIFLSTITYLIPKINARWFAEKFFITKLLYKCSYNKWFVDEIYSFLIIRPVKSLARLLAAFDLHVIDELVNATGVITKAFSWISGWFDLLFVDGLVNATATILHNAGSALSLLQSGKIRSYLVLTMLGALLLIALFIFIF